MYEVEEILTWDILKIEDAKQLIDILPTTLKVIDHDYSDDIIACSGVEGCRSRKKMYLY